MHIDTIQPEYEPEAPFLRQYSFFPKRGHTSPQNPTACTCFRAVSPPCPAEHRCSPDHDCAAAGDVVMFPSWLPHRVPPHPQGVRRPAAVPTPPAGNR